MTAIVFFNIGWMNSYRGVRHGDEIRGGGAWVNENAVGHEVYNFAPYRGRYYGCVQPPGGREIHIERLGAAVDDDHVDNVTIAWVAKDPTQGLRLVGWYSGARLFRHFQQPPVGAVRPVRSESDQAWFIAVANVVDSVLLDPEDRTLPIPRNKRGAMGQSNVWYADSLLGQSTIEEVRAFIRRYNAGVEARQVKRVAGSRDMDQARKIQVEQSAINAVRDYYESRGFRVSDVQRDNVGWDLEAARGEQRLLIEVKGLSGSQAEAELTPNEYHQMRSHRNDYRLCIVSDALSPARLRMRRYAFMRSRKAWVDQDDCALMFEERTAARVRPMDGG